MKKCTKCNIEKPLDGFNKHKPSKNGINSQCKVCVKEYNQSPQARVNQKKYYKGSRQKILQYHKDNPEGSRKAQSKYYLKNKEKVKGKIKDWRYKIQGVYGIFENGECLYVGESSMLKQRISQHKWRIKYPDAENRHKNLYHNLSQHNHLVFGVIEECDNHKKREQHFIDMYNPLYNA